MPGASAIIDGATERQLLFRLVLPQMVNIVFTTVMRLVFRRIEARYE
jgi:ABC-type glycerol-3-phosphate transport system permease component